MFDELSPQTSPNNDSDPSPACTCAGTSSSAGVCAITSRGTRLTLRHYVCDRKEICSWVGVKGETDGWVGEGGSRRGCHTLSNPPSPTPLPSRIEAQSHTPTSPPHPFRLAPEIESKNVSDWLELNSAA